MDEMKKLFFLILAICLVMPAAADAAAETVTADSKITAVTVYANRAAVTRTARVKIGKGAQEVVFGGLPAQIDTDSLRVEGRSRATVTIGALMHKQVISQELTSERERELNEKLQLLRDQIASENIGLEALQERQNLVGRIGDNTPLQRDEEFQPVEFHPEEWAKAAQAVQQDMSETLRMKQQHDMKIRKLNEAVAQITEELRSQRTGQRSSYQVTVPLDSSAAADMTIELTYQVQNASWHPIYDARLETAEKGRLELVQYGAVKQLSGEDWNDVALTLSTAQPQRGTSPPAFSPMWLMKRNYDDMTSEEYRRAVEDTNVKRAEIAKRIGGAALPTPIGQVQGQLDVSRDEEEQNIGTDPLQEWRRTAKASRAKKPGQKQARFVAANIETGGFISEYKVAGPATILSDNTESKLLVGSFETESKLEVHVQPAQTTEAFLVAHSKLKGETPILPGPVSLFRDGAYIGKSRFPLLRPEEEHNLSFGIDDQISVKRNKLKDKRKEDGLIIKESIIERNFVSDIQNLRKTPVDIRLREVIPVSKSGDVKIEILKDKTSAGYKTDVENIAGLTEWVFTLKPEQKQEMRLGWKVTWPKDQNLSGLPQ
ncbi:MAG: mucoidy inhibitor MuiA family protein [Pseudomonadota bacterium]|nr:MAG: mucoidy inhibitor MuiA family protein [Pseudomonadota bacterium]